MGIQGCYCALHKLSKGCSNLQPAGHLEKNIYVLIDLPNILDLKKHYFERVNFKLLIWAQYFTSPTDKLCQCQIDETAAPTQSSLINISSPSRFAEGWAM